MSRSLYYSVYVKDEPVNGNSPLVRIRKAYPTAQFMDKTKEMLRFSVQTTDELSKVLDKIAALGFKLYKAN